MVMRDDWAGMFLRECGYPVTRENVLALVAWQAAEGGPNAPGGQAKFNPLNTTLAWPGSTIFNYANVRNYPTLYDGLGATEKTLKKTRKVGYWFIRRALCKGDSAGRVLKAVERSTWGTGGLALQIIPNVRNDRDNNDGRTYYNVPIGQ